MANKPQRPDQKVVFGITTETESENMVIVLQVPPGGWEYMQDGTCHTFDLSKLGVPVKIMLSGCKDRAEAVRNIEAANAAKGYGTLNMAGTDFGIK